MRIIDPPSDGGETFALAGLCCCICRRIVSASGIPGVGVTPGFIGFPAFFGSGMPGVGVAPLGTFTAFAAGMPGVEFDVGEIGLAERPGGRLLASILTNPFEFVGLFALFAVELAVGPQAVTINPDKAIAVIAYFFI